MTDKRWRKAIASAIYYSRPAYMGSMRDCLKAADAVLLALPSKQLIKRRVGMKHETIGNIVVGENGPRVGLLVTAAFKQLVADAPMESCLNFLVFPDDRK
ncbi:hypothetical protein BH10PLA2_BH10PLA2_08320 [soil metagenome]